MKLEKKSSAKLLLTAVAALSTAIGLTGLTVVRPLSTAGKGWARGPASASSQTAIDFKKDIEPILQASCVKCHGGDNAQGKLRLDSEAGILKGGGSGPVIVPGHSGDSSLVKRISGLGDAPRMPMGGDPLPSDKID